VTLDRASEKAEDIATVLNNDLAYEYMAKTCTDNALEYVRVVMTANSHGDVRMAWKNLYDRYHYATGDPIALRKECNNCKMKKPSDNPCQWYAELEYLFMQMEHAGMQRKTKAKVVAIIMKQIPAEYKVVMSALRAIPVKKQTLDLVRVAYWEYWDANLKGMEQPNESKNDAGLDNNKEDKNKGDAFFVGMSIKEDHETVMGSSKALSKNEKEGATEAELAGDEVQLFWHRTQSQQQEYEEFLRSREAKFIQEAFGGEEELEPKQRARMCVVCGVVGPWNLVCDE